MFFSVNFPAKSLFLVCECIVPSALKDLSTQSDVATMESTLSAKGKECFVQRTHSTTTKRQCRVVSYNVRNLIRWRHSMPYVRCTICFTLCLESCKHSVELNFVHRLGRKKFTSFHVFFNDETLAAAVGVLAANCTPDGPRMNIFLSFSLWRNVSLSEENVVLTAGSSFSTAYRKLQRQSS